MGSSEHHLQPGQEPDGTRWLRVAMWTVAITLVAGGYFAFAPATEEGRHPDPGTEPGQVAVQDLRPHEGYELLHASWGPVGSDAATIEPAPEPSHRTEWQEREHAFQQMARERWKGTEIFVRKRER